MVFGSLFAPLIHMAVSRQREYTADATGAKILHNPDALADALEKIGCSSHIRALSFQNNFAVACIVSPFANFALSHSYHPPVEERIRRLRAM